MKSSIFIITLIMMLSGQMFAQSQTSIGMGYFGHTATYPGVVLEWESAKMQSASISTPFRIDLMYFYHPRSHSGIGIDLNYGFRRHFDNGIFLEESIGIGILETMLSADAVFEVDDAGNIKETTRFNEPDIMPSITMGLGYQHTWKNGQVGRIWLRPKLFWQYPHKTSSTYNGVIQVGYSYCIASK